MDKELAHIREKFAGKSLDGYGRKKYIWKLLYIFMLGYDVEIGHMEAMQMITSSKYSEKSAVHLISPHIISPSLPFPSSSHLSHPSSISSLTQHHSPCLQGYVACSILLNETHPLLRMIIQSIKNDLNSRDDTHQCLALACIANVGGQEFAESLTGDVQKLLFSRCGCVDACIYSTISDEIAELAATRIYLCACMCVLD